MPRLRLEQLTEYPYSHTVKIRVSDLNYGSHLANDRLVSIVHQARVELLEDLGFSELDLGDNRSGIMMCDLQVIYKSEAFLNEILTVQSAFTEIKKSSFRISNRITCDKRDIALVDCGFAAYDYKNKQISSLPEIFLRTIKDIRE